MTDLLRPLSAVALFAVSLHAQDLIPRELQPSDDRVSYSPITLKEKYFFSLEQMFTGPRISATLIRTAMDHAQAAPHAWGSDAPSFSVRLASHIGRNFVRTTISSGIRGIDHEDPRYFYSRKEKAWDRTRYAVIHSFIVHNDNGSTMPAYSRFISDFGMPFLAQTWHPEGVHPSRAMRAGGISLGVGVGITVAQEFWPDIRKKLHLIPATAPVPLHN